MRSTLVVYCQQHSNHAQTFGGNLHHQPPLRDLFSDSAVSLDTFFFGRLVCQVLFSHWMRGSCPLGGVPLVGRKGRGSFDHCQLQPSAPPTHHNPSRSLRLIWLPYLRVVGLCGFISVLKWPSPNTYHSTHTARGVHDMCDLPLPVHVLQVLQAKEPPQGPKQVRNLPREPRFLVHIRRHSRQQHRSSKAHVRTDTNSLLTWLCVRTHVRFGGGATVALRCMPSTCAGCHVFRGAAGNLKTLPVCSNQRVVFPWSGYDGSPD